MGTVWSEFIEANSVLAQVKHGKRDCNECEQTPWWNLSLQCYHDMQEGII